MEITSLMSEHAPSPTSTTESRKPLVYWKVRGRLGNEPDTQREIRLLDRIIRADDDGAYYEADRRHAELNVRPLGLQ